MLLRIFFVLFITPVVFGVKLPDLKLLNSFSKTNNTYDWYHIDSLCQDQLIQSNLPGLAVVIMKKGEMIWAKGYGCADIEKKIPVDPEQHMFRIGSISKTLTALALGKLEHTDRMSIDVPIGQYLDTLPDDKKQITIRQLGGHLGGIRHYRGNEFESNIPYNSVGDALSVFIRDTLLYAPGTTYHYTSYGWNLLSAVMEAATGVPFLELMKQEITDPLSINHMAPDHKGVPHNRPKFYFLENNDLQVCKEVDLSNKWAGGGFLSSATDLARVGDNIMNPEFFPSEILEAYTTPQITTKGDTTTYGVGFAVGNDNGHRWFGHGGGSVGGTSMLLIYPDSELTVITLSNLTGAKMNKLAWRLADWVVNNDQE